MSRPWVSALASLSARWSVDVSWPHETGRGANGDEVPQPDTPSEQANAASQIGRMDMVGVSAERGQPFVRFRISAAEVRFSTRSSHPNCASVFRMLTLRGSVLLGSLRRRVCLVRPFTKPWASDLPNHPVEVLTRGHRHDQRPAVRSGDLLSRLFSLIVGHYREGRAWLGSWQASI